MSYSSEVLADSPLAYYRLGEGSGTTLVDSSGNGRNGAWGGAPTRTTGLLVGDSDGAVKPNGFQAQVVDAPWMDVSDLTVEAWVKIDTLNPSGGIVDRYGGGGAGVSGFILYAPSNKFSVVVRTAAGDKQVLDPTTLSVGTTYHVVGTCDGTTLKLYVNNVLVHSVASGPLVPGVAHLLIGRFDFGNVYTIGTIDEVAIYDHALDATRIDAHYTAGTSLAITGTLAATLDDTTLAATGTVTNPVTGTLSTTLDDTTLAASGTVLAPVTGTLAATLDDTTLAATGSVLTPVGTDTSNALNGRVRGGGATVTMTTPVAAPPDTLVLAQKVDKARAFPTPDMVGGRPT